MNLEIVENLILETQDFKNEYYFNIGMNIRKGMINYIYHVSVFNHDKRIDHQSSDILQEIVNFLKNEIAKHKEAA